VCSSDLGNTARAFSVSCDALKANEASAAVGDFCEAQGLERRKTMLLSLAIEELIALIADKAAPAKQREDISVRLMFFTGGIVLRLRCGGHKFNAVQYYKDNLGQGDFEDRIGLMGVKYIVETAEVVYYRETFGVNNLVIII
jgi:hypothetical protein